MQASIESTGNLERRLTFSLPEDRLQTHISGRLGEIARTARIKGFRPGKIPAKVIEQRFGQQVRSEAVDGLLRETFDAALREHELRMAGTPRIDKGEEGEFSFVATVELIPDFGDVDVSKLTVVRHTADISDADIDRTTYLRTLKNQCRQYESALQLLKQLTVLLADFNEAALNAVAEVLIEEGQQVQTQVVDVSSRDSVRAPRQTVQAGQPPGFVAVPGGAVACAAFVLKEIGRASCRERV